jgi:hypothetical protein
MHLTHVDQLGASIDALDAEVDRVIALSVTRPAG